MSKFINLLQERMEGAVLKEYYGLSPNASCTTLLIPIRDELQLLVDAKAKFVTDKPFKFHIETDYLSGDIIVIDSPEAPIYIVLSIKTPIPVFELSYAIGPKYFYLKFINSENLLEELAIRLTKKLSNLGTLDRNIYSKKSQDTLEI